MTHRHGRDFVGETPAKPNPEEVPRELANAKNSGFGALPTAGPATAPERGLRHDGGGAETGTGVEWAAGVDCTDPDTGLSPEANGRALVAHEDAKYREWGALGAMRLAPGERRHAGRRGAPGGDGADADLRPGIGRGLCAGRALVQGAARLLAVEGELARTSGLLEGFGLTGRATPDSQPRPAAGG